MVEGSESLNHIFSGLPQGTEHSEIENAELALPAEKTVESGTHQPSELLQIVF